ncbi:MAG: hypothetical protein HRT45_05825 [Bdellovibrionales bacterium]|nr:hypothetical protein [Bdellovibrionales bacterium]
MEQDKQEQMGEVINAIGSMILQDVPLAKDEFDAVSTVAHIDEDGGFELSGYTYKGDSSTPFVPDENFEALRLAYADLHNLSQGNTPEDTPFKAVLITITNPDLAIELHFEYDNEDRWKATPANIDTIADELRPKS